MAHIICIYAFHAHRKHTYAILACASLFISQNNNACRSQPAKTTDKMTWQWLQESHQPKRAKKKEKRLSRKPNQMRIGNVRHTVCMRFGRRLWWIEYYITNDSILSIVYWLLFSSATVCLAIVCARFIFNRIFRYISYTSTARINWASSCAHFPFWISRRTVWFPCVDSVAVGASAANTHL